MELAAMEEKRKKEADKEAAARLLEDKPSLERPGSAMPGQTHSCWGWDGMGFHSTSLCCVAHHSRASGCQGKGGGVFGGHAGHPRQGGNGGPPSRDAGREQGLRIRAAPSHGLEPQPQPQPSGLHGQVLRRQQTRCAVNDKLLIFVGSNERVRLPAAFMIGLHQARS